MKVELVYYFGKNDTEFIYEVDVNVENEEDIDLDELRDIHYSDALEQFKDNELLRRDPYAYYGMSQRDFHDN